MPLLKKIHRRLERMLYRNIILRETWKELSQPSENEKRAQDNLLKDFKNIPVIDTTNMTGAELQWSQNMNRLRELVLEADIRKFLQWDVIRDTMFVGNEKYILKEYKSLKSSNDFNNYWYKGIESEIGQPITCKRFNYTDGNSIHSAYHIQQFEEKTNLKINQFDFVFEFGGGYGCMCRLFNNFGFNKKYAIFDLPAFSMLQKYYLESSGYKVLTIEEFSTAQSGILCLSDIDVLKTILKSISEHDKNLFIATWSISETPMKLRNEIFRFLEKINFFLITYQNRFKEIDNIDYFKGIQKKFMNIKWDNTTIKHIPGNNYLIGYK